MESIHQNGHSNSLPKAQRLHGKKDMGLLFASKTTFFHFPFKVVLLQKNIQQTEALRFMISASKRNFKLAVDRNRIKRLAREAWRTQKAPLIEQLLSNNQNLDVGLIYTAKTILTSNEINNKIKRIIERLMVDYDVYKETSG